MRTYLELVNAVLRRMREDEVSDIDSSSYSKLVRDFVKESVQEVEGGRAWNALRTSISATTAAGTYQYALTDVGTEYEILYVHVTGPSGEEYDLEKARSSNWMTHKYLSDDGTQDAPRWYDVNGVDSNGDPIVNVYPVPDGVYSLYFTCKVRTVDDPTNTTKVYLPERPIILRGYMFALEERGDIGSDNLGLLEERFNKALGTAMQYDGILNEDEMIWTEE